MASPIITVNAAPDLTISDEIGNNSAVITFTADQVLKDFVARANGASYDTGIKVEDSGLKYASNTLYCGIAVYPSDYTLNVGATQQVKVDYNELTGGDVTYRINVYGKNANGEWSIYG